MVLTNWHDQEPAALQILQAMAEHWSVNLSKNVFTDLHHQVWPDPDDVAVERCMVELAHSEPVADDWEA